MAGPFTILNVMGPFREPSEPVFSYDYSVQRPTWATPQGIRVKVSIEEELECLKKKIVGLSGGTTGQIVRMNQLLCRSIADKKIQIANEEDMFNDRLDVMIDPFTDSLSHLFPRIESWMDTEQGALRQTIKDQIGV